MTHNRYFSKKDREKGNFMICIVCRNPHSYPVTFIRAHIKHLPARIQVLHWGTSPRFYGDQNPLEPFLYRLNRKIAVFVFKLPREIFQKKGLTRFLIKNGVDAVLVDVGGGFYATLKRTQS